MRLIADSQVVARQLTTVSGSLVAIPDSERWIHLQFRRFAGCPVCNLHLRSVVRRHAEIEAAGIREVVVFHSSATELRQHTADLPFAVVADPDKRLYREFGVESGARALLSSGAWLPIAKAVLRSAWGVFRGRDRAPAARPHGGRLGLPADLLIACDGRVVAGKYGEHVYDQWSVDELLELAAKAPQPDPGVPAAVSSGPTLWGRRTRLGSQREVLPGVAIDLRTAGTDRGPIEYDLHGAEGPVVLSLHAGLGGADQGRLLASWLQDDGFRILSPSRPGYLGTPLSSGQTLDEQADLLAALLDELNIDQVSIFVISSGSPVAYTFAARQPRRVWGLVSVGGVSLPDPGASPRSRLRVTLMNTIGQKLAKLTASVSLKAIVSATLNETSTFTADQKAERAAYILGTEKSRLFFKAMFDGTFPYEKRMPGTDNDSLQTREMDIAFDRVTAPTLILHSTQDGDVPFEHGENAATKIPGAQHHWIPDDDHLGFWLGPRSEDSQRVVRAFLHEHAPRR